MVKDWIATVVPSSLHAWHGFCGSLPLYPKQEFWEGKPSSSSIRKALCSPGCWDEAPNVQCSIVMLSTPCLSFAASLLLHEEQQGPKCVLDFAALFVVFITLLSSRSLLFLLHLCEKQYKKMTFNFLLGSVLFPGMLHKHCVSRGIKVSCLVLQRCCAETLLDFSS